MLLSDSCLPRRALEDPVHGQCGGGHVSAQVDRLDDLAAVGQVLRHQGLERETPLATTVSVSAWIDKQGGLIAVPGAGFWLYVPKGAVPKPMTITVTAREGSKVAYDFGPEGTQFKDAIWAIQSLAGTQAKGGGTVDPDAIRKAITPTKRQRLKMAETCCT